MVEPQAPAQDSLLWQTWKVCAGPKTCRRDMLSRVRSSLADIRQVAHLRRSSVPYLLPKSYVEKLARRPEIVQAYVRRGSGTSVSARTLIENLDRLCIEVDEGMSFALYHS